VTVTIPQVEKRPMEDSKDILDAHPKIQEAWPVLLDMFRRITTKDLFITCTYRTPQTQQSLYQKGRTVPGEPCWHKGENKTRVIGECKEHPLGLTVTTVDGFLKVSNHNHYPSRAIDFCVDLDPDILKVRPTWNEHFYYPLYGIARELGLVSGGGWKYSQDWPHVELPSDVT